MPSSVGLADVESANRGRKWPCSGCSTEASFMPGYPVPSDLPSCGWRREPDGRLLCPACVADRKAEDARKAAAVEMVRDPDARDGEIARRVRGSGHEITVGSVSIARRDLLDRGVIESRFQRAKARRQAKAAEARGAAAQVQASEAPKAKPKRAARPSLIERYPDIVRELRTNPTRGNWEIAHALGLTSESTVRRTRWAMEAAGEIEVYRAKGRRSK